MAKRVFFSFHYQDVADFRANVVRQSWVTKADREEAGFFDASLWESSRRTGDVAIKRLINDGLNGSSHTAVLIGENTFARKWVRYEIFKSLERGNGLTAIHINKIKCKNGYVKQHGANPFSYLAVKFNSNGDKVSPYEWNGQSWILYSDVAEWKLKNSMPQNAGKLMDLTSWYKTYCWVDHNGYQNFGEWI